MLHFVHFINLCSKIGPIYICWSTPSRGLKQKKLPAVIEGEVLVEPHVLKFSAADFAHKNQ